MDREAVLKKIEAFNLDDEIPSTAKFLVSEEVHGELLFFYEVPIKLKKTPKNKEEIKKQYEIIERIINYLNRKTNGKYTTKNKAAVKHIEARLSEDAKPEDFKTVIDNMCDAWLGDVKMSMYLRPATLFGNKFFDYLSINNEESNIDAAFSGLEALNQKVLDDEKRTV